MKPIQINFQYILLIFFLAAVFGLSNCGQYEKTNDTAGNIEPAKQVTETPVVNSDTLAQVPTPSVNKQPEAKADTKKEIPPITKNKEPELVKKSPVEQIVVPEKKVTPNTNVTPVQQPPVVKIPEPVKPIPEQQPKQVEVPKPVVVVTAATEQGDWIVPAKYKNMTNPYAVDKESLELGKTLYGTHCKSCHGSKGEGNGAKAANLDTKIRSFLSPQFLSQKPGDVFYKTIIGRGDMPKFEKKIPDDEERWAIVHYIMNIKN